MRLFIKYQLSQMRKSIRPRRAFRADLWMRLSDAYQAQYQEAVVCIPRYRFAFVGISSVVLMFGMGTGVYAYESPEVVEGHPLYFMKSGIEGVEARFARSPEARARFHARMMERRLEEGELSVTDEAEVVESSLESAADQFEMTIEALESLKEGETEREKMIETLSIQHARYLELSQRVQTSEDRELDALPLRVRAEGHQLSDEERKRIFEQRRKMHEQDL